MAEKPIKLLKPATSERQASAPPLPTQGRTFWCPTFDHQKHSDACAVLRAKGACRVNCAQFYDFVEKSPEVVSAALDRHRDSITRKHWIARDSDLLALVLPKGEHRCEFCAKPFKQAGSLVTHLKKKHKREMAGRKNETHKS